jgi:hypothetical protein
MSARLNRVAMAGLVPAQVVDPTTARQVVGIITGMGRDDPSIVPY